jgi:hypothetical protein
MTNFERISKNLGEHPEIIIIGLVFFMLYYKINKKFIDLIYNKKLILIILAIIYYLSIFLYGISNILDNIVSFLFIGSGYSFFLTLIYSDLLIFFGKKLESWTLGSGKNLTDCDAWIVLFSYVPIIGTIPITIRIYQKLAELEKEMKKQGVTNLVDFKPLEKSN